MRLCANTVGTRILTYDICGVDRHSVWQAKGMAWLATLQPLLILWIRWVIFLCQWHMRFPTCDKSIPCWRKSNSGGFPGVKTMISLHSFQLAMISLSATNSCLSCLITSLNLPVLLLLNRATFSSYILPLVSLMISQVSSLQDRHIAACSLVQTSTLGAQKTSLKAAVIPPRTPMPPVDC